MTDDSLPGSQQRVDGAVRTRPARDRLSIAGLVIVFTTTLLMGSLGDIALVTPLLIAALVVSSPLGFAAGQLALIPTVTIEQPLILGATQLALLAVLTEPARTRGEWPVVAGTLFAVAGLSAVVGVGLRWGLVEGGLLLISTVAVSMYFLHRLSRVQLGLVTPPESEHSTHATADTADPTPDNDPISDHTTSETEPPK